eukprot:620665_1
MISWSPLDGNMMRKIVLDLCNDLLPTTEVPDPKHTLTTLHMFDMDWCWSVLYRKRNELAKVYLLSISNGVYDASKNGTDIESSCKELVKEIEAAQEQFQHDVDWNMLCTFCERFASLTIMILRAIFCINIGG